MSAANGSVLEATEPEVSDYFYWHPSGKPVAVLFNLATMRQIDAEVRAGFKALPRRGLEVGGLLLGAVDSQSEGVHRVRIEAAVPFDSEHLTGPSFALSDADLIRWDDLLSSANGVSSGHRAVGYYRSHTRDGFSLDEEDGGLIGRCFPAPDSVFLLIKPQHNGPSRAGFFAWENDEIDGTESPLEFPLSPHLLLDEGFPILAGSPADFAPPAASKPAPAEPSLDETRRDAPALPSRREGKRIAFAAALGLVAAAIALCSVDLRPTLRRLQPKLVDSPPLSLSAERKGGALRVSWNHLSPAIQQARGASLLITDGTHGRTVDLSRDQLLDGSVLYWSRSPELTLRLNVDAPAHPQSESLRVIGPPEPPSAPVRSAPRPLPLPLASVSAEPERLRRITSRFIPIRAVHLVRPELSVPMRNELAGRTLDVRATVRKDGSLLVDRVLTHQAPGEAAYLARSAAQRSRFLPARVDSRPVQSHVLLHYRF